MNLLKLPLSRIAAFSLIAAALTITSLRAQDATQDIALVTGWNSVWLEVEPAYASGEDAGQPMTPADLFTNPAVLAIATPKPLAGLSEFFGADPGTIGTFNQDEWQQWKRTDPSNSNNLPLINGNRAYLIQTSGPVNQTLTGKARFFRPTWTPDRYNLVGFGLSGTPTFKTFFSPSAGKHYESDAVIPKIFRLVPATGNWQRVTWSETMVSDQAYWVFSNGPSSYMGPVAIDFDYSVTGTLNFGGPGDSVTVGALDFDLEELVFTNLGGTGTDPELDLITADSGSGGLALHVVNPATDGLGYVAGNQVDSTPGAGASSSLGEPIASQSTATLTLGAQRLWSDGEIGRTNLYRLKTGTGSTSFWLPVTALNNELQLPTDLLPTGDAAGLWVGEIIVEGVTSIVEAGAPNVPAAGSAPIRMILHSDGGGAVKLLSQVTVMRTKTADPDVPPVPVLVVDPAEIPFFEGVKERNGKRVGLRIEAVAYDMPRKLDAASQAALLADETYPDLTEEGLSSFLVSSNSRPPTLAEKYHLSWPMAGAVGVGKTVQGTLSMDPFHRSNPFRHAYHHNHPKGPNITRDFEIVFDAEQAVGDRLRGEYTEVIHGLVQSDLTLTGHVEFHRVSTVDSLD